MKISIIHSFYRAGPSGENQVVLNSIDALLRAGHEVELTSKSTDVEKKKVGFLISSGLRVATGRGGSPLDQIMRFKPDVVNVHNLFPNWGTYWLRNTKFPTVATIHNYRTMCSAGTLQRNGRLCELCPTKGSHHSLIHGCYQGSRLATVPLAISTSKRRRLEDLEYYTRLIFLSTQALTTYERLLGLPIGRKAAVIPNFVPGSNTTPSSTSARESWIYLGRLSEEKGILQLIQIWPEQIPLTVIGDGPLRGRVRALSARKRIKILGEISNSDARRELTQASGLVFCSTTREGGTPLSYLEALEAGKPVLAWGDNFVADDVRKTGVGLTFESPQELQDAIRRIYASYSDYSKKASSHFRATFTGSKWLSATLSEFQKAIDEYKPLDSAQSKK